LYTFLRVPEMFLMTLWKEADMWLRERSVKTTEYSSSPSGSTSGSRPGIVVVF
jgi:hypothetical protein